jgi:hypothetical protein
MLRVGSGTTIATKQHFAVVLKTIYHHFRYSFHRLQQMFILEHLLFHRKGSF